MKRMFVSEKELWADNHKIELPVMGEVKYIPGKGYLVRYPGTRCEINEVNKSETDVNFIVSFPEYPGLIGGGDTIEEALIIAVEALEMYKEIERYDKSDVLSEEGE